MAEKQQYTEATESTIHANVAKNGCHIVLVSAAENLPDFAYSIGLFQTYGHPEIICFGLAPELLETLLKEAHKLIKQGKKLVPGYLFPDLIKGFHTEFLKVNPVHYPAYFSVAQQFYSPRNFPALQLVWPDKQNKFPWEAGFNPDLKFFQPLLDRNEAFQFQEDPQRTVFTTRQVLAGDPILHVYHNENGDWQFTSQSEPDKKDAKVTSLEAIVKLDATVNALHRLPFGWCAWRNSATEGWKTAKLVDTK